jgi:hypothetical protein
LNALAANQEGSIAKMDVAFIKLLGPTCVYVAAIVALNCWSRHNAVIRAAIYSHPDKFFGDHLAPSAVLGLELSRLVVLLLSVGYGMQIGDVFPEYRWTAVGTLVALPFACFTYKTFLSVPIAFAWAIFKFQFSSLRI